MDNPEVNQETVAETQATPAVETPAEAKAAPKPRAAKLTTNVNGADVAVLKYPFPVKASKFPIKVNGDVVDAASTSGRGKSYTYFIVNGTSFYVPGLVDIDDELTIDFPADYAFDTVTAERKSYYKPKKAKAEVGEGSAASASEFTQDGGEAGTAVSSESSTTDASPSVDTPAVAEAPKAARRKK